MKQSTTAALVSYLSNPNVIGNRVRSSEFIWSPETRSFVGEASDFRGSTELFRSLFLDAADLGFVLVSEATGNEALFYLAGNEQREGEVVAWTFRPTEESVRRSPGLLGVRVVCLND